MFEREELVDLNTFVVVAQELSFTRAGQRLETSQSAVSYRINRLETRIGVRLFNRSSRAVVVNEAGLLLMETLSDSFSDIGECLAKVSNLGDQPVGKIRITIPEHAIETLVWTKLSRFIKKNPQIKMEIFTSSNEEEIATNRFDVGIRLVNKKETNPNSIPLGPPVKMAVVGAPSYFEKNSIPLTPNELENYACISYKRLIDSRVVRWEFSKNNRSIRPLVGGSLVVSTAQAAMAAGIAGHGLAYLPEDYVSAKIGSGELIRILDDWCPANYEYRLYCPSLNERSAALNLLISEICE